MGDVVALWCGLFHQRVLIEVTLYPRAGGLAIVLLYLVEYNGYRWSKAPRSVRSREPSYGSRARSRGRPCLARLWLAR